MSNDRPRRRVRLTLDLGADSWNDLASALLGIAIRIDEAIERKEERVNIVSGSPSSGFLLHVDEDETITHESFGDRKRRRDAADMASLAETTQPPTEDQQ